MSEQKNAKPKIEDIILELLNGEVQKNALDFVAYLRANKNSLICADPVTAKHPGAWWYIKYKGKIVGKIGLEKNNRWHIVPANDFRSDYERLFTDEKIKKSALENIRVKPCKECQKKCIDNRLWLNASILGKEYEKICKFLYVYFLMPDAEAVECAKKIVEMRCDNITAI